MKNLIKQIVYKAPVIFGGVIGLSTTGLGLQYPSPLIILWGLSVVTLTAMYCVLLHELEKTKMT